MHRLVALAAMVSHFGFIAFVVVGGFAAWWVPWLIWPHLGAVTWSAYVIARRRPCPLTALENWGRRGDGRPALPEDGFMAHYLDGRLYPRAWAKPMQALVFACVAVAWLGLAQR
jgi:hypothetical protein